MGDIDKVYTLAQVSEHNNAKSCWLLIGGKVYDVTKFLDEHPGGGDLLVSSTGKDASEDFDDVGHSNNARDMLKEYYVGEIDPSTVPYKPKKQVPPPLPDQPRTNLKFVFIAFQLLIPFIIFGVARLIGSSKDN